MCVCVCVCVFLHSVDNVSLCLVLSLSRRYIY